MPVTRSAAILVVVFALLGLADRAGAALSRLTPTPPVALTAPAPAPASPLPRTGNDIPRELLLAATLLGVGGILRLRWSADRS